MVKIPPNIPPRTVTSVKSTKNVEPVEAPVSDKSVEEREGGFVERRKNPDRRRQRDARGLYEMRSGKDRRRRPNTPPFIDTDV